MRHSKDISPVGDAELGCHHRSAPGTDPIPGHVEARPIGGNADFSITQNGDVPISKTPNRIPEAPPSETPSSHRPRYVLSRRWRVCQGRRKPVRSTATLYKSSMFGYADLMRWSLTFHLLGDRFVLDPITFLPLCPRTNDVFCFFDGESGVWN